MNNDDEHVPTRDELRAARARLLAIDLREIMPATGKPLGDTTAADLRASGNPEVAGTADEMELWKCRNYARYVGLKVSHLDFLIEDIAGGLAA